MSPDSILAKHSLHYIDLNSDRDRTVLLLHGLGVTGESWYFQFPALEAEGYRILAPDARGFGKSTYPGSTSVSAMAADFSLLMDKLNVNQADVVGISMGGALALQLTLDHPDRVGRLVLVNTFASLRPRSLKVWAYFLYRFLLVHTAGLDAQARFIARRLFRKPDQEGLRRELIAQVKQASPVGYRATMRALGLFDITSRLGEIHSPTLVITGEKDNTVPPDVQSFLVKNISGAKQVIVPDAGHAVSVEKPEIFNHILIQFLTDRN